MSREVETFVELAYQDAAEALQISGALEDPAEGIVRRADDRGWDSLSEAQVALVRRAVDAWLAAHPCSVCGNAELDDALSLAESGLCGWHAHVMAKD